MRPKPEDPQPGSTKQPRDSHVELPLDPDYPPPLHHRPEAWAWVFAGGIVGTGLRWVVEEAMPTRSESWPWGTFVINVVGAFVLAALLEGLAASGTDSGWRQRVRLFGGTGVCGAFTTYSTLALEVSLLGHDGAPWLGLAYGAATVVLGAVASWAGIAIASTLVRRRAATA